MNNPHKTWKFTEFDMSKRQFYENLDVNVIVFGEETCPETKRLHLQGHVSFKRTYRLTALKKLSNAHWEPAKCEDFNYELKGENIYKRDERKKKGQRTDLEHISELVVGGATIREIASTYPGQFIRYGNGIKHLMAVMVEPRNSPPVVTVIYGSTGTGKSRAARDIFKDKNYYVWTPQRGKWFDGYYGQDYVIMEEFRGQLPLGFLLTLLDRYECPVETKGGMTEFNARNIIITSPSHPRQWYDKCDKEDTWKQLERRISEIIFSDDT